MPARTDCRCPRVGVRGPTRCLACRGAFAWFRAVTVEGTEKLRGRRRSAFGQRRKCTVCVNVSPASRRVRMVPTAAGKGTESLFGLVRAKCGPAMEHQPSVRDSASRLAARSLGSERCRRREQSGCVGGGGTAKFSNALCVSLARVSRRVRRVPGSASGGNGMACSAESIRVWASDGGATRCA